MKRLLALLLVLCFAVPVFAQSRVYFNGSFDGARATAQQTGKQLVVFFYSDG